jgi:periplasmic protein TonB
MLKRILITLFVGCTMLGFAQSYSGSGATLVRVQVVMRKVRVSTGVMLGMVDHKTMPVYPDEAMKKGIQGDVIFKIDIDETGRIEGSEPLQGDTLLVAAGKDALQTFHFRPYLLDGTPMKVETRLGFHFSVEKTADGVRGHVECMTSIPAHS